MLLKDLINNASVRNIDGNILIDILSISCDSREAQVQGLFVAISGSKLQGSAFIKSAVEKGAIAIAKVGEGRGVDNYDIPSRVTVINVDDTKLFLKAIGLAFYDYPSQKVQSIAVTGTNGKTTVTYLLESILKVADQASGIVGTINTRIGQQVYPTINTTPGFLDNQRFLRKLANAGIGWCVMETSSHALDQGRVDGIDYKAAIFTNLTQDHLDYHGSMENYFNAKALLFKHLSKEAVAIINSDDPYGLRMLNTTKAKVLRYAIDNDADVKAVNIHYSLEGIRFDLVTAQGKIEITNRFIGKHNVYNILSACACALGLGFSLGNIKKGIEACIAVPGRLEPVLAGQKFHIFIDYAHTDDGLINVISALRKVSTNRLIVVFGCGGDRDNTKRPKMARAVSTLADYAIVTSDNPRSEDPQKIIDQILVGMQGNNYEVCVDRREAIGRALAMAKEGEIILIAGKGHEDYQILHDRTISFDERKIVRELLEGL